METATIPSRERAGKEGSSRAAEALLAIESSKNGGELGDTRTLVALSDQEARKLFSERSLARASSRGVARSGNGGQQGGKSVRPAPELIEEEEVPEYDDYVAATRDGRDAHYGEEEVEREDEGNEHEYEHGHEHEHEHDYREEEKYEEDLGYEGKEGLVEEDEQHWENEEEEEERAEEEDELHHPTLQAQAAAFDMSDLPFDPHGHPSPNFAEDRRRVRHQPKKDRGRMQNKRLSQRQNTHEPEGRFRIRGHSP